MIALLRRLDYDLRPRLRRREVCKRCWRENPVGFSVPNDVWRAAVPARHTNNVLCLLCFDRYATRRGVDWGLRGGVEFFPVPGAATSSCRTPSSTCTDCTPRLCWAWSSARRSQRSASPSNSGRSAMCRTGCPSAYAIRQPFLGLLRWLFSALRPGQVARVGELIKMILPSRSVGTNVSTAPVSVNVLLGGEGAVLPARPTISGGRPIEPLPGAGVDRSQSRGTP